ncbi:diguanylate cyclase [Sulfobacillus acidophilus TPY]|nr:diguanylate cyclase [Sulfobacillus acidophilus TPY]
MSPHPHHVSPRPYRRRFWWHTMAVFMGYGILAVGIAYGNIRTMTPTRDIALGRMMVLELFCTLGLVMFLYRLWLQDIVHPLQHLAERDDLTGVWRSGAFWRHADRALKRLQHSADPHDTLAFAFLDIDDFKAINDTYGHLMGDAVLRAMGRHLRQGLRSGDSIGRLGGEEFGCILRQVEADTVRDLFMRIRECPIFRGN